MGKVVEQGTGGTAGIVGAQLLEDRAFESLHQFPVRLFFFQPIQGQAEEAVEGFQAGIRLGGLLNGLGKVGGGEDPGVGLAKAGVGSDHPGFPEMMQAGSSRRFPADFAFMKKIKVAPHGTARLGCSLGQGPHDPVVPAQPDGQQAGLSLATEMEQNSFILKRLAQDPILAEGANREDKRDDSRWRNV